MYHHSYESIVFKTHVNQTTKIGSNTYANFEKIIGDQYIKYALSAHAIFNPPPPPPPPPPPHTHTHTHTHTKKMPSKWTIVRITCHETAVDRFLWFRITRFEHLCRSVQLFHSPLTWGSDNTIVFFATVILCCSKGADDSTTNWGGNHFEGILPKGAYLPCVSMVGRALLAEHPRFMKTWDDK